MKPTPAHLHHLRSAIEPGFDAPEAAASLLASTDPHLEAHGSPAKVRNAPCHDCAVIGGLYAGIAACAWRYLDEGDRQKVAEGWTCHNGGRCEGAYWVLLAEEEK
jgi:hypothetical protein